MKKGTLNSAFRVAGAVIITATVLLTGCVSEKRNGAGRTKMTTSPKEFIVGEDISYDAIMSFEYTYETTTAPVIHQHYEIIRDYSESAYYLEYWTREGDHYPLKDEDETRRGKIDITDDFVDLYLCLTGGKVTLLDEYIEYDEDGGLWTYLYWQNSPDGYTVFTFENQEDWDQFVETCDALIEAAEPIVRPDLEDLDLDGIDPDDIDSEAIDADDINADDMNQDGIDSDNNVSDTEEIIDDTTD